MEAPPVATAPAPSGEFVALSNDAAACCHWRAKGSCRFGEKCQRASTHVTIEGPSRGLLYALYKTPREEPHQCLLRRTFARNGFARTKDVSQTHLLWANILPAVSGNSNATDETAMLRKLSAHCRVNHYPRSFEITHKDKLYRNLRAYGPLQKESFLPRSFILPAEADGCAKMISEGVSNSIWIAKPDGLGEGRGILVLRNPDFATLESLASYVIQRYISRPLLLPCNRKKFDLRIYLVVLGWEPKPRILLYRDGLVRFAAAEYVCSADTLSDLSVHLCNNAVNRKVDEKINGKNWTVCQLQEYMAKEPGFETSFAHIWEQIRFAAVSVVQCASSHIVPALSDIRNKQGFKGHLFELLGMDILVDEDRRAWLCEVNHMPDIGCTSRKFSQIYKSDFNVKSRLLADLLNILFPGGNVSASPIQATQLGNFEELSATMQQPQLTKP